VVCVVLGRQKSRWWPLEVCSFGSGVDFNVGAIHLTLNPLLVEESGSN
jgi:hypothetical protein